MKFPSLFKISRHQRFHIEPRYYDPVREEIDARTSQIRAELRQEENDPDGDFSHSSSRISGAFTRRASRRSGMNMMQLVILLLLIGLIMGFWYFGNIAVYVILILSSLLLYLKVKRIL